jgi:hypothetical protein
MNAKPGRWLVPILDPGGHVEGFRMKVRVKVSSEGRRRLIYHHLILRTR